jgi:putative hemolysin
MILEIKFVILLLLLFLSAFFSGVETAFISLSKIRLQHLKEKKKKGIDLVMKLRENRERLLITILIGNNFVNIAASALATSVAIDLFGSSGVGIVIGVMTLLILIFGEITPKTIAMGANEWIAIHTAKTIRFLEFIFFPLIIILEKQTSIMSKPFKGKKKPAITEEEIISVVNLGKEIGEVKEDEREMIHNIFKFGDQTAEDIMVPRTQIYAIDSNENLFNVIDEIMEEGYSRIPVYEETIDNIIGILYLKDLMRYLANEKKEVNIKDIIKPALYVPESMPIDYLLKKLKKAKNHIAIVVDEHGGFSGIVTIEDMIEEIVGEIYDETDKEEVYIRKITPNKYIVKGETEISYLNNKLKLDIEKSEEYETISGFILETIKRMPEIGEKIEHKNFFLNVTNKGERRIIEIEIILK